MATENYPTDTSYAKNKTLLLLLVLLCFPFIQLGLSFYVSFQILAFILVLFIIPIRNFLQFAPVGIILFAIMCLPVLFSLNSGYAEHDFLKTAREFFCYSAIYAMANCRSNILESIKLRPILKKIVPVLLISLLGMTIVQTIF